MTTTPLSRSSSSSHHSRSDSPPKPNAPGDKKPTTLALDLKAMSISSPSLQNSEKSWRYTPDLSGTTNRKSQILASPRSPRPSVSPGKNTTPISVPHLPLTMKPFPVTNNEKSNLSPTSEGKKSGEKKRERYGKFGKQKQSERTLDALISPRNFSSSVKTRPPLPSTPSPIDKPLTSGVQTTLKKQKSVLSPRSPSSSIKPLSLTLPPLPNIQSHTDSPFTSQVQITLKNQKLDSPYLNATLPLSSLTLPTPNTKLSVDKLKTIVFPDIKSNILVLLHALVSTKVLIIHAEGKWKELCTLLSEPTDPNAKMKIYMEGEESVFKHHVWAFPTWRPELLNNFSNQLKDCFFVSKKAETCDLIFPEGLFAGAGHNDAFMLDLLNILLENNVPLTILLSARHAEFICRWYLGGRGDWSLNGTYQGSAYLSNIKSDPPNSLASMMKMVREHKVSDPKEYKPSKEIEDKLRKKMKKLLPFFKIAASLNERKEPLLVSPSRLGAEHLDLLQERFSAALPDNEDSKKLKSKKPKSMEGKIKHLNVLFHELLKYGSFFFNEISPDPSKPEQKEIFPLLRVLQGELPPKVSLAKSNSTLKKKTPPIQVFPRTSSSEIPPAQDFLPQLSEESTPTKNPLHKSKHTKKRRSFNAEDLGHTLDDIKIIGEKPLRLSKALPRKSAPEEFILPLDPTLKMGENRSFEGEITLLTVLKD